MLDLNNKFWNEKYLNIHKILGDKKYSEHQEDAIVEAVFKKNKPIHKYFVDVGAYGERSSNTWTFMEKGWNGLMIEQDKNQAIEIATTIKSNVKYLKRRITQTNLEDILLDQGVPYDFDFLSIDVDNYEYEIWKNMNVFKPKLVCIEVNQVEQNFEVLNYDPSFSVHEKSNNGYGGATIGLMNKLAEEKGYDYLCWDVSNAFYIRI